MSQIEKEKLAQKFLETLYAQFQKNKNVLSSAQYNILERARKSGLNMQGVVHALQAIKIVKKEGYPGHINYSWIEKAPNSTMVKKFLGSIKEHQDHRSEVDRKRREKASGKEKAKGKVKETAKEIIPVTTDNPKILNIYNAISRIYELMKDGNWIAGKHIRFHDIAEKNKVAAPTGLSLGMQRAKVVERSGGGQAILYKWIGDKPSITIATQIENEMREYFKEKNTRWKEGKTAKRDKKVHKEEAKATTPKKPIGAASQLMVARAKRLMELGEKDFAYQLLDELL